MEQSTQAGRFPGLGATSLETPRLGGAGPQGPSPTRSPVPSPRGPNDAHSPRFTNGLVAAKRAAAARQAFMPCLVTAAMDTGMLPCNFLPWVAAHSDGKSISGSSATKQQQQVLQGADTSAPPTPGRRGKAPPAEKPKSHVEAVQEINSKRRRDKVDTTMAALHNVRPGFNSGLTWAIEVEGSPGGEEAEAGDDEETLGGFWGRPGSPSRSFASSPPRASTAQPGSRGPPPPLLVQLQLAGAKPMTPNNLGSPTKPMLSPKLFSPKPLTPKPVSPRPPDPAVVPAAAAGGWVEAEAAGGPQAADGTPAASELGTDAADGVAGAGPGAEGDGIEDAPEPAPLPPMLLPLEHRGVHPMFLDYVHNHELPVAVKNIASVGKASPFRAETRDVVDCLIKPATFKSGYDYVQGVVSGTVSYMCESRAVKAQPFDLLPQQQTGRPFYGPATYFVSHAWGHKWSDLVGYVMEHYDSLPGAKDEEGQRQYLPVYYWLDVFAVSQHYTGATALHPDVDVAAVVTAPHCKGVLLMSHPWGSALAWGRTWCLYEALLAFVHGKQLSLLSHPPANPRPWLEEAPEELAGHIDVAGSKTGIKADHAFLVHQISRLMKLEEANQQLERRLLGTMRCMLFEEALAAGDYGLSRAFYRLVQPLPIFTLPGASARACLQRTQAAFFYADVLRAPTASQPLSSLVIEAGSQLLRQERDLLSKQVYKVQQAGRCRMVTRKSGPDDALQADGLVALAGALAGNTSLTSLGLHDDKLEVRGLAALSKALAQNAGLRTLRLTRGALDEEGGAALAPCLETNSCLTCLDVSANPGLRGACFALLGALKANRSLQELLMVGVGMAASAVPALSKALGAELCALRIVDLSGNPELSDHGAMTLATMLERNRSVEELRVAGAGLSCTGACALLKAAVAGDHSLAVLDMRDNDLRLGQGRLALLVAEVVSRRTFRQLNLLQCLMPADVHSEIQKRLGANYFARQKLSLPPSEEEKLEACMALMRSRTMSQLSRSTTMTAGAGGQLSARRASGAESVDGNVAMWQVGPAGASQEPDAPGTSRLAAPPGTMRLWTAPSGVSRESFAGPSGAGSGSGGGLPLLGAGGAATARLGTAPAKPGSRMGRL